MLLKIHWKRLICFQISQLHGQLFLTCKTLSYSQNKNFKTLAKTLLSFWLQMLVKGNHQPLKQLKTGTVRKKMLLFRLEFYNFYLTGRMHNTAYSHSIPKHNYYAPLSKRFPEDIECIIQSSHRDRGSLYISNIEAAENPNTLQRYNIKAILSCAKGYELNHSKHIVPHYQYIAAVDHQNCNIYPHFNQAVDFIEKHLKSTNVLVHCVAGVSRSVSMVIAYLIRQHKMTDVQAYSLVKSRRKIINPNEGFRKQLKDYHKQVNSNSTKLISSERLLRTPQKQATQNYRPLYKSPIKHEKTASTFQKSYDQPNTDKYERKKIEGTKRNLFQDQNSFRQVQPENGNKYLAKTQRKSYQQKYTTKYYSPVKANNYKEMGESIEAKQKATRGYIHNLSQDLDQRIEKIKQKYEIHKKQLEEKYPKRVFDTYMESSYASRANKLQNSFVDHRFQRLKTQSFNEYPKKSTYLNELQKGYKTNSKNYYPNVDSLFPNSFASAAFRQPQKTTQQYGNGNPLLNNSQYVRSQTQNFQNHNELRYKGLVNSYNRDSFKKYI